MNPASAPPPSVRADQWLWAARFFKTRSLAKQAIDGGKIEVNGARCKPARAIHVGERLAISRGTERFEVVVTALAAKRGPATQAVGLYAETSASIERREREREAQRLSRQAYQPPDGRPNKRDRRHIVQFERSQDTTPSRDQPDRGQGHRAHDPVDSQ